MPVLIGSDRGAGLAMPVADGHHDVKDSVCYGESETYQVIVEASTTTLVVRRLY